LRRGPKKAENRQKDEKGFEDFCCYDPVGQRQAAKINEA